MVRKKITFSPDTICPDYIMAKHVGFQYLMGLGKTTTEARRNLNQQIRMLKRFKEGLVSWSPEMEAIRLVDEKWGR